MPTANEDQHMERIAQLVFDGNAALFIGAGASQAAGVPSTTKLVESIKSKFPKARFRTDDFMDVCQSVIDSDYYDGRRELEQHIRAIFMKVKPAKWHYELTKYDWKAIFTTNFDDLIEQAFRASPFGPRKDFYPVLTEHFSVTDRSTLFIFKLMGTVLARGNDPGRLF